MVAEGRSPLGEHHAIVAGGSDLLDRVGHVLWGQELALFDVDRQPGFAAGVQQIGLAAQESRHLQHVDDLGHADRLFRVVDIGDHRQSGRTLDLRQGLEPRLFTGPAEARLRGAIGLVEGRLEDQRHAVAFGDLPDLAGDVDHEVPRLDDARTGDVDRAGAATDGDAVSELEALDRHRGQCSRRPISNSEFGVRNSEFPSVLL